MTKQLTHQYPFRFDSDDSDPALGRSIFQNLTPSQLDVEEQRAIVELGIRIVLDSFKRWKKIDSPEELKQQLRLLLAGRKDEVFWMLFLDNKHRIIEFKELFHGSIGSASVYPRVIVREALALNSAAVILVHNHPSGVAEPSWADEQLTDRIKQSLEMIEVRVLDHIVVGFEGTVSFAERGLL